MGESHDDRLARKKRERREYLRKQKEQDDALQEAIEKDPQLADYIDYDFERQIKQMTGVSMSDMRKVKPGEGVSDADVDEAMEVIAKAKREAEGGVFRAKNPKKAKRTLENSKAVKKVSKKAKKDKGCAVVALLMLTIGGSAFGSLVWGAVEVVSALAR
jgi:hypothetical protein